MIFTDFGVDNLVETHQNQPGMDPDGYNHASDFDSSEQRADIAKSIPAPNHEARHHVMSLSRSTRPLEAIAVRQDGVGQRRSGAALTRSGAHHDELHIGKLRQPI